jgi:hypothetical protein
MRCRKQIKLFQQLAKTANNLARKGANNPMTRKIAGFFERVLDRRSFLGKLAAGATTMFASVLGFGGGGLVLVACCELACQDNSGCGDPCSSCPPTGAGCGTVNNRTYWCWSCCNSTSNFQEYYCIEGFAGDCTSGCSYALPTGATCGGGGPIS